MGEKEEGQEGGKYSVRTLRGEERVTEGGLWKGVGERKGVYISLWRDWRWI